MMQRSGNAGGAAGEEWCAAARRLACWAEMSFGHSCTPAPRCHMSSPVLISCQETQKGPFPCSQVTWAQSVDCFPTFFFFFLHSFLFHCIKTSLRAESKGHSHLRCPCLSTQTLIYNQFGALYSDNGFLAFGQSIILRVRKFHQSHFKKAISKKEQIKTLTGRGTHPGLSQRRSDRAGTQPRISASNLAVENLGPPLPVPVNAQEQDHSLGKPP